jgi:RNA polymerase sigma-70 factor (ECF subfamily)
LASGAAAEPLSDETLMQRFQRGHAPSFRVLVERWSERVFAFSFRHLRDEEGARDVAQETFLRVVRNAASFRAESRFSTWLFTIARNLCVDRQRRQKLRRTMSLDAPLGHDDPNGATLMDRVAGADPLADRRADDRRFSDRLERALAALPVEQREVFLLREVEGVKFREIADLLQIPENTVKSRMRYALEALRKHLAEFGDLSEHNS